MTLAENALGDVRAEWVVESTPGTAPADPQWNRFSDYILSAPGWSGDANVDALDDVLGSGDIEDHFRGPEDHSLSIEYLMQRFFTDNANNVQDPIGVPLKHSYGEEIDTHTVVFRRETDTGGNFGNGYRQYVVGVGCRPVSGKIPGDPSEGQPIALEVGYECERVRSYVVHKPDSTDLTVSSTDSNDTFELTIEDEGAGTSVTNALNGTNDVTFSGPFGDVDAIDPNGNEPVGDITVTDGNGTNVLETPTGTTDGLVGSNTDGVDGDSVGIPKLGAGSHASAIGTDPADYTFLGTSSTYKTSKEVGARIHALDFNVELETSKEPIQGTRRQKIDIGSREVTVDADTAGEFDTHRQHRRHFEGLSPDITYTFGPGGELTAKSCTLTDVGDLDYDGDEANVITSNTYTAGNDPAVTLSSP